ncbi:TIGR03089 family protein [Ruania rhizosphaerae]|uniref:TIGR03089 family protein n=1 Tax=Ruania rhizosphaerae TaxID=1840413 RepID=UPI00135BC8DC|nr:TIGR03089 family protein [Ruania rhizosphaerae]
MPGIATLLDRWTSEPGRPRLTWYGPGGERVELTGRVLANWVAKAANLLTDEADLEVGGSVTLDLPAHWRTAVWALAAWACGASVTPAGSLSTEAGGADVLVTTETSSDRTADVTIVIALPALAMSVEDVPPGALDGAAELMSQPDVLIQPVPHTDGPAAALLTSEGTRDLLVPTGGGRVMLDARGAAVEQMLIGAMHAWSGGGSVVLVGDPDGDLERIAQQEGTDGPAPTT